MTYYTLLITDSDGVHKTDDVQNAAVHVTGATHLHVMCVQPSLDTYIELCTIGGIMSEEYAVVGLQRKRLIWDRFSSGLPRQPRQQS
jgi:hypothetical protein